MQVAVLYLMTALVFLVLDAIMLRFVLQPMFKEQLGDWLLDNIRWGPAIAFYLCYVAGILWFVSVPALRSGSGMDALIGGFLLGALAYGTYEVTNYATLRAWGPQLVAVDVVWGAVLTALTAWAGLALTKAIT